MITVILVVFQYVARGVLKHDLSRFKLSNTGPFMKLILNLTCTHVGMLSFNNLCLKNVGIAFYQVARSSTLIFPVILSVLILRKSVPWKLIGSCLCVSGGFVLGVVQKCLAGTHSPKGVLDGILTSYFVSLN